MTVAYIAHPVAPVDPIDGADAERQIDANLEAIRVITRNIFKTEPRVVPFVPYWLTCHALSDLIPSERAIGIQNNIVLLTIGIVTELRLYGPRISSGMWQEINIAKGLGIPVISMTEGTYHCRL